MRVTTADRVRASARVTRRIVSRGGSRLANRFAWADRAVVAQVTAGHPDGSTARGARSSLERPFCRLGRIEAIWGLSWLSFNIRTSSIETVRILYKEIGQKGISKLETCIFEIYFILTFLHYIAHGKGKIVFFSRMVPVVVVCGNVKITFSHDWICGGFEDWSLSFSMTPRNLLYDFFRQFMELWIDKNICNDEKLGFLYFSSGKPNIHKKWFNKKWRKKIIRRVLGDCFKEKISIFKFTEKFFNVLIYCLQFIPFSKEEKYLSSLNHFLRDVKANLE